MMSAASHIEVVLRAKDALPALQQRMFKILFQEGDITDREASRKLALSDEEFDLQRTEMIRSLKRAVVAA